MHRKTDFELFIDNILCRRETNQHKAKKYWHTIKDKIPDDLKSDFEVEWIHYLQGSLGIGAFCQLCVKPLENYIHE